MGCGKGILSLIPIALTVACIVCLLTVCLAGITNTSLQLFEITTANFSASPDTLANIAHEIFRRDSEVSNVKEIIPQLANQIGVNSDAASKIATAVGGITDIKDKIDGLSGSDHKNITAKTLGLAEKYEITIWNYCKITGTVTDCSKPKFKWATKTLNNSEIESWASEAAGTQITLPDEIKSALFAFAKVSKATQLSYTIALIVSGLEVAFGFIAMFFRARLCLTFLIAGFATFCVAVAAILATVQASLVTAAVNTASRAYDISARINTSFLATTWLAVAFSIGAGIIWALTSCCCVGGRSSRGRSSSVFEKPRSNINYQRMNEP